MAYLRLTIKKELERVDAICYSTADDWKPVIDEWWKALIGRTILEEYIDQDGANEKDDGGDKDLDIVVK